MTYEKQKNFIYYMRWMQENDLDCLVITSAPKGFGKSSSIIQIGRGYIEEFGLRCLDCNKTWIYTGQALEKDKDGFKVKDNLHEPCPKCNSSNIGKQTRLDFMKHLAYDNDEIREVIYEIDPYSPILADEGVRFLMGEDWMTTESKTLKKLFAQMRTKHLIVLANIPKFAWIDKKYRNVMASFWVRILKRGLAVLMQPDLGETDDPWHLKEFEQMLGSYFYFTPDEALIKKVERMKSRHPCVFDYFNFPPVPEDIYKEYLTARNRKVFERRNQEDKIDQKELAKICSWNIVNRWPEIQGAIKISRFDRPTFKLMEEFMFKDPKTEEKIIGYTTIRNWINEIDKIVGKRFKGPEQESYSK